MHPVIILSIVTLIAVLAIGAWQLRSVRASQAKRGEIPGETTITRKPEAPLPPLPTTRQPASGDTTNVKRQSENEAHASAAGLNAMSKEPVATADRIRPE